MGLTARRADAVTPNEPSRSDRRQLLRNITTNYFSVVWLGVVSLALIPWYLAQLGTARWGIVALCMTFQALITLLDVGLSQMMPRDIARTAHDRTALAGTFRTFASCYLLLAVAGFLIAQALVGPLVTHWIRPSVETASDVMLALRIVLIQFLFQFANNAHTGYWNGIQAQTKANLRQCIFGTGKHVGAVALLFIWRSDEIAYLIPFVVVSMLEFASNRRKALQELPAQARRWASVGEMRALRAEGGVLALGVVAGMLLSQIDRIFLSGSVDVTAFGCYAIVANLGLAFMQLQLPLARAFLPRLAEAHPDNRPRVARQLAAAIVAMCVVPCLLLILVAPQILSLWIGSPRITELGTTPLRLILAAVALNSLYQIRYISLLIAGRSSLIFAVNVAILLLVIPTAPWIVETYGIDGGGLIWLLVTSLQIVVSWFALKLVAR